VLQFDAAGSYPVPFKFDDILIRLLVPSRLVLESDASRPPRISIYPLFLEQLIVQSRLANSAPLRELLGQLPNRHLPVACFSTLAFQRAPTGSCCLPNVTQRWTEAMAAGNKKHGHAESRMRDRRGRAGHGWQSIRAGPEDGEMPSRSRAQHRKQRYLGPPLGKMRKQIYSLGIWAN